MKLLSFITPEDLGESFISKYNTSIFGRIAVRAVLLNDKNQIALMHIANYDGYKLPGGGVDDEENIVKAFEREIQEETGYECDIINEIGMTVEKRDGNGNNDEMVQVSLCYIAKATKFVGDNLMEDEKESGFELVWIDTVDEALDLIKSSYKDVEDAKFMSLRDESILIKAKELM